MYCQTVVKDLFAETSHYHLVNNLSPPFMFIHDNLFPNNRLSILPHNFSNFPSC